MLVEIVNDDGTMKRAPELRAFADEHGLAMISIEDLVRYRRRNESLVERVAETRLPTSHGDFTAYGYRITVDGSEHVALVYGDVTGDEPVLTRVHSECLTGDVFGADRCDCGPQLDEALDADRRPRAAASSSTCAATRAAGSAWSPSCGPTSCRTAGATPSTPTSTSACRPTPATTAPRPRSCATSASAASGC